MRPSYASEVKGAMAWSQMLSKLGGEVQIDDAFIPAGKRMGGKADVLGRGTEDAPFIVAISSTRMAIRATSDASGGTYEEFASWHVSRRAHILADDWGGIKAGMVGWDNIERRKFNASSEEASLPAVHHAISNFKSMILGTHHGVTFSHLQEYCDQFSWRYCHRQGDAFADLLYDIVRWPHTSKHLLSNLMSVQEPMGSKEFKETYSN